MYNSQCIISCNYSEWLYKNVRTYALLLRYLIKVDSRNLWQRSILARKGTFYEKGHQKFKPLPLFNPFSKCFTSN